MQEKLFSLSRFWSEAKYNFINYDKINFNFDSLYYTYIDKISKTRNDYEYHLLIQRFAASLNDSQTKIQISDHNFGKPIKSYLVEFKEYNHKVYITAFVPRKKFKKKKYIGSEVISINGLETREFLSTKIFPYLSASTKNHLYKQALEEMSFNRYTDSLDLKLKIRGRTSKVKIFPVYTKSKITDYKPIGKFSKNKKKAISYNFTPDSILILNINKFHKNPKFKRQLWSLYDTLINQSKGVILDLRHNKGGDENIARSILGSFVQTKHIHSYGIETRIHNAKKKTNGNFIKGNKEFFKLTATETIDPKTITLYHRLKVKVPSCILIGKNTCASTENALMYIYEIANRPQIIGEETCGILGNPLILSNFAGGNYARININRHFLPFSRKMIIRSGIVPDLHIKETIDDYLNDYDPVLEKGINLLKEIK
ncbi:MAG: S41 family peptidase [Hyphomicrobiales bacterium]